MNVCVRLLGFRPSKSSSDGKAQGKPTYNIWLALLLVLLSSELEMFAGPWLLMTGVVLARGYSNDEKSTGENTES